LSRHDGEYLVDKRKPASDNNAQASRDTVFNYLLAKIRGGDQEAWTPLEAELRRALQSYIYRLVGNWHAAEDVFQATLMTIYLKHESHYDPRLATFSVWVSTIATNKALDFLRRGRRGPDLLLMSAVNDVDGIPTRGKNLIIVAAVKHVLHFRIFDGDGERVVDTNETWLTEQTRQIIEDLRKQLNGLWTCTELTKSQKNQVIATVTSIVPARRAPDPPPLVEHLPDTSTKEPPGDPLIGEELRMRLEEFTIRVWEELQKLPQAYIRVRLHEEDQGAVATELGMNITVPEFDRLLGSIERGLCQMLQRHFPDLKVDEPTPKGLMWKEFKTAVLKELSKLPQAFIRVRLHGEQQVDVVRDLDMNLTSVHSTRLLIAIKKYLFQALRNEFPDFQTDSSDHEDDE
jgi:DNA-directed RNA polymerase specialized sigma24 family protein